MRGDQKGQSNATEILHKRYIKDDPERRASIERDRINVEVAQMIYDIRTEAELTQKELAESVGTTQSVISRLEDADYDGHSLSMLNRIAKCLKQKMTVLMTTDDDSVDEVRYVFREVIRGLRRERGLTVEGLAKKLDLDRDEVVAMERNNGYRPSPLTLHKLSKFFGMPHERLGVLAGAVTEIPGEFREQASRFAAKSDSFTKLSREEKRILDDFVRFLKTGS